MIGVFHVFQSCSHIERLAMHLKVQQQNCCCTEHFKGQGCEVKTAMQHHHIQCGELQNQAALEIGVCSFRNYLATLRVQWFLDQVVLLVEWQVHLETSCPHDQVISEEECLWNPYVMCCLALECKALCSVGKGQPNKRSNACQPGAQACSSLCLRPKQLQQFGTTNLDLLCKGKNLV